MHYQSSLIATSWLVTGFLLSSVVAAPLLGRLGDLLGRRRLLLVAQRECVCLHRRILVLMATGSLVGVAAYLLAATSHHSAVVLAVVTAGVGVTFGLTLTGIASVVVRPAKRDKTSVAAGVNSVLRTTGSAIATAAATALITGAGLTGPFPDEAGYTRSFVMGAIAGASGFVAAALLPGRARAGV